MRRLEGKVALVSGAGRGIGRAIALKLVVEGARVVINDLDEAPAAEAANLARSRGGEAALCVGDVTDVGFGERFVATAIDTFGALDIIVNNAGYTWDNVIQKPRIQLHLGPGRHGRRRHQFLRTTTPTEVA